MTLGVGMQDVSPPYVNVVDKVCESSLEGGCIVCLFDFSLNVHGKQLR